jgi:3'-phosphoadenosine 5'-phosphosulfate sulfotransferase (PAPS reductase)/FAD synthetase
MSKWVKGLAVKPLCVYHPNGRELPQECELTANDAAEVRSHVSLSKQDLRRLLRYSTAYVLFSGGLDSLCTLAYLHEVGREEGADVTALHIDTTAGFPEVTKYVRSVCRRLRIPLRVVRPKIDYFEAAKKWGIPSHNARWCCHQLKVRPVRDFLARQPSPKVVYDGIRAAESFQRSQYLPVWHHPAFDCLSVSPILGWSDDEVRAYVEAKGLPENPAKSFGCSAECWCGAYKKRTDFEKLLEVHPDIFEKLVAVEKAQKGRYTFIYENGRRVPLSSLLRRRAAQPETRRR